VTTGARTPRRPAATPARTRPASARKTQTRQTPAQTPSAATLGGKAAAARRRRKTAANFLVLTGMSGAGKSHAMRALEDLGYYCVDNLPTPLIPVLAELSLREDAHNPKVAVVVDVRERSFIREFPPIWRRLAAMPDLHPVLVFLEASDAALLRRFSETRRPHPLAPDRPVAEALAEERQILGKIRAMADEIVDTSDLTVHELRQIFHATARDRNQRARLIVTFESFGFKHGVPIDADLVFDCRFLPNPHFVPELRPKTGRDKVIANYMRRYPATREFTQRLAGFLRYVVPHYVAEGKSYLTVAIGCTGGRHRSVYLAESLKKELTGLKNVSTRSRHRDLGREG
jgi:RNase adapter protein RapZ